MSRKSYRLRSQEPSLLEAVLDIAWSSPAAGVMVSAILLFAAMIIESLQASDLPWSMLIPVVGTMLVLIGLCGLLVSAIGFVRDLFGRR